jgi:mitochondrial fission protein ELM1
MKHILILSDGRMGHVNQSIAFANYLGYAYDIVELVPKYRWSKAFTYLFDKIGMKTDMLFHPVVLGTQSYALVVGTGSLTYYMVKVLSKKLQAKSIAMMLPKGYNYNSFDTIFAQSHDRPPKQKNIIEVPANFAYAKPQGLYKAKNKSVGIVIGGDNKVFNMSKDKLKIQLDAILKHYNGYEIAVTTSPRTSKEVEALIQSYHFDYEVIFSQQPVNPIPDFLYQCECVCITGDSTSMISEAVSYGKANIIVLPLESKKENKFERFMQSLEKEGYLYIFDGGIENRNRKIDFSKYFKGLDL